MADYFTNFSIVLPLKGEPRDYALNLVKEVEAHRNDNQPLPDSFPEQLKDSIDAWCFDTETVSEGLWLHSQYGGQDSACVFIQHLLQKFGFGPHVAFEWSHDCSQPRLDAYGGGAAFVTVNEIEIFTTSEWLQTRVR
jgi:hypothetical protein